MKLAAPVFLIVSAMIPPSVAGDNKNSQTNQPDPAKGVNFYSIGKEIALGKQMADNIERQTRLLRDPLTAEFVNRLGQNLARNSDSKLPFQIKVIDSEEVNAFALPGGFMYVNTGLVLKTQDEAELAGVMAHEIAHIAARHATKQATREAIINYASIPLVLLGGWAGYAIREAATLAVPLGFLQFSRSTEREADRLGLQYMLRAGYDPNAFVDFFERIQSLEQKEPGTVSRLFSTHPMTRSRITRAQQEIQRELAPRSEYVLDTSEFREMHQRLERLDRQAVRAWQDDRAPVLKRRNSSRSDNGDERPTLKRPR